MVADSMSRNVSQTVADLFTRATSPAQHLGDEIRKVICGGDTMFGKFNGLLESLRTIIPDEKQRYQAALKALSASSKQNRLEILKAMNGQLDELRMVEQGLASAQQASRDELTTLEARSQGLKNEIANLRARMAQLEGEEKAVQDSAAARQKDLDRAAKGIKDIFTDIREEIHAHSRKVEALPGEAPVTLPGAPAPPPAAQSVPRKRPAKSEAPVGKKDGGRTAEIKGAAPRKNAKFERTCPMCGGPFHLLKLEKIWQCYTCANEEWATDAVQGTGEEKSEPMDASTPVGSPSPKSRDASSSIEPASMVNEPAGQKKGSARSSGSPAAKKKSCPVCFKKMIWNPGEKVWRCPAGHHESKG